MPKLILFEIEHKLNTKTFETIQSFHRCNSRYDGYVFVPQGNGKVKTGAFITEVELLNRKLISEPAMIIYFDFLRKAFYRAEIPTKIPNVELFANYAQSDLEPIIKLSKNSEWYHRSDGSCCGHREVVSGCTPIGILLEESCEFLKSKEVQNG